MLVAVFVIPLAHFPDHSAIFSLHTSVLNINSFDSAHTLSFEFVSLRHPPPSLHLNKHKQSIPSPSTTKNLHTARNHPRPAEPYYFTLRASSPESGALTRVASEGNTASTATVSFVPSGTEPDVSSGSKRPAFFSCRFSNRFS